MGYAQDNNQPELVSVQKPEGKHSQPNGLPPVYHEQEPVEAPGSEPAELWHGNYRP
jgi:hypothetical protein